MLKDEMTWDELASESRQQAAELKAVHDQNEAQVAATRSIGGSGFGGVLGIASGSLSHLEAFMKGLKHAIGGMEGKHVLYGPDRYYPPRGRQPLPPWPVGFVPHHARRLLLDTYREYLELKKPLTGQQKGK